MGPVRGVGIAESRETRRGCAVSVQCRPLQRAQLSTGQSSPPIAPRPAFWATQTPHSDGMARTSLREDAHRDFSRDKKHRQTPSLRPLSTPFGGALGCLGSERHASLCGSCRTPSQLCTWPLS